MITVDWIVYGVSQLADKVIEASAEFTPTLAQATASATVVAGEVVRTTGKVLPIETTGGSATVGFWIQMLALIGSVSVGLFLAFLAFYFLLVRQIEKVQTAINQKSTLERECYELVINTIAGGYIDPEQTLKSVDAIKDELSKIVETKKNDLSRARKDGDRRKEEELEAWLRLALNLSEMLEDIRSKVVKYRDQSSLVNAMSIYIEKAVDKLNQGILALQLDTSKIARISGSKLSAPFSAPQRCPRCGTPFAIYWMKRQCSKCNYKFSLMDMVEF